MYTAKPAQNVHNAKGQENQAMASRVPVAEAKELSKKWKMLLTVSERVYRKGRKHWISLMQESMPFYLQRNKSLRKLKRPGIFG
jgi:hypothetical protein